MRKGSPRCWKSARRVSPARILLSANGDRFFDRHFEVGKYPDRKPAGDVLLQGDRPDAGALTADAEVTTDPLAASVSADQISAAARTAMHLN